MPKISLFYQQLKAISNHVNVGTTLYNILVELTSNIRSMLVTNRSHQ